MKQHAASIVAREARVVMAGLLVMVAVLVMQAATHAPAGLKTVQETCRQHDLCPIEQNQGERQ